jgi:hypothetical protein
MEKNIMDKDQDLRYYLDDLNLYLKHSYRQKNKLRQIFKIYIFVGLAIAVVSVIYFVSSFFEFRLTSTQRISLIFSGAGLFLSLIAKFYIEFTKEKEREYEKRNKELERISDFIVNWAGLERAINHFLLNNRIDNNKYAIGSNIALLSEKGIINTRDLLTLEKALDLRNRIVHDKMFSEIEILEKLSDDVVRITDKIIDYSEKNTMYDNI